MAHNSVRSTDLRVRRTRSLLQQALKDLTIERGFPSITVRDIVERAMVNRSTFYRHYLDKYDMLDGIIDDVYNTAFGDPNRSVDEHPGPIGFIRHIQQSAAFYRIMLGPKGDQYFTQKLQQGIVDRFRYLISITPGADAPTLPPVGLRLEYVASATIGAITWWLENGQPIAPEELAAWMTRLNGVSAGIARRPPD